MYISIKNSQKSPIQEFEEDYSPEKRRKSFEAGDCESSMRLRANSANGLDLGPKINYDREQREANLVESDASQKSEILRCPEPHLSFVKITSCKGDLSDSSIHFGFGNNDAIYLIGKRGEYSEKMFTDFDSQENHLLASDKSAELKKVKSGTFWNDETRIDFATKNENETKYASAVARSADLKSKKFAEDVGGSVKTPSENFPDDMNEILREYAGAGDSYTEEELMGLFHYLEVEIYFRDRNCELSRPAFESLSPKSKLLLFVILTKADPSHLKQEYAFSDLEPAIAKLQFKRNEEKQKLVYKSTISQLLKHYKKQHLTFKSSLEKSDFKDLLTTELRAFYFWLFRRTIGQSSPTLDFVMDICGERVSVKEPLTTPQENWRRHRFRTMKKVSRAFRFLVKSDAFAREKMLKYLKVQNSTGVLGVLVKQSRAKLDKKLIHWKKLLIASDHQFSSFVKKMVVLVKKKGCKHPWTKALIEDSINRCEIELQCEDCTSPDLGIEYDVLKKYHYSFN